MSIKSINLLPEIFRSDANRKFLAATVDQLISESDQTVKLDSYAGRRDAPTWKTGDTYITEPNADRQNYQIETSVIVDGGQGQTDFYSSYLDLLQQIGYYGGITTDHSRLFGNQAYTFDGCFDIDKFVNFTQYLWLPDGPPEVTVTASNVDVALEYNVNRSTAIQGFQLTEFGTDKNPIITLIKGQTYKFHVNQAGNPFWIQTRIGATGSASSAAEALSRTILGLDNNGLDVGTIEFRVPLSSAQDKFVTAPLAATVDFATDKSYVEVQSQLLNQLARVGGIDGIGQGLNGKTIIFTNTDQDEDLWTDPGNFDFDKFDELGFEFGETVPGESRRGVFRIRTVDVGGGRYVVKLDPILNVTAGQKVYVRAGNTNANVEFILNTSGYYEVSPVITAPLDTLYYQDGNESGFFGTIRLIDPGTESINVEADIIGAVNYTSPNQVVFTNGLHVKFDNTATPAYYANNNFIVEGVGTGIKLVNIGNLIAPEQYAVDTALATPDYITVNRSSSDLNAWSRSNRWFHIQTVEAAAAYREDPTLLDLTGIKRGKRPIIEFDPNIYLFNYGRQAKSPVNIIDFTITDAFKQVEGAASYTVQMPNGITRQLTPGTRIIFAADIDPDVRNKIYRVDEITSSSGTRLHLVSQNTLSLPTYEVTGARITSNLSYNFVPSVTFSTPLPGIGTSTATGNVILKDTGVDAITVDYTGAGYIADPYIKINSEFTTEATTEIVYAPYKHVEYIRVDAKGTAYTSTSPNVTISNPNQYYGSIANVSSSVNGTTFELLGVTASQWLGIQPGVQVLANGIVGGTFIIAVDDEANLVTINSPAVVSNLLADPPVTGLSTVADGDTWTFKPNATAGTYATVTTTIKDLTTVVVNDTSMIDVGMVVSGGSEPINISAIRIDTVPTRIITTTEHNLQNGDVVLVRSVIGTTELNFSRFYVSRVSDTAIDLYVSSDLAEAGMQDSRNFTDYISGGTLTSYTVDYGTTLVEKVISETEFITDRAVSLRAGTRLVFGGVPATATARSDGNGIYSISVEEPGSGYATAPTVTIESSSGNQATATAIVNDDTIGYIKVTDAGTGYKTSAEVTAEIISSVEVTTSEDSAYGTDILYFADSAELLPVQPGWLVLLVTEFNSEEIYTDFGQVPYAETTYSGPDPDTYRFFMDVTKTRAVVRTVDSVDTDRIVLDGPIYSLDSDGETIDLPAGSKIFITSQARFFTSDGYGSSARVVGTTKTGFVATTELVDSNILLLDTVMGIQPGMLVSDISGLTPAGITVKAVDGYQRKVTLSSTVTIPALTQMSFSTNGQIGVELAATEIDYIDITSTGSGYTDAPVITIEPRYPEVTLLGACAGTTTLGTYLNPTTLDPVYYTRDKVISVSSYNGVVIGAKVTSNYDNQGVGVTTGSSTPVVVDLVLEQTASDTFEPRIVLSVAQPTFSDLLVTFRYAAEALALVEQTNSAINYDDDTPETYDVGDTVLVSTPANESQTANNVVAYNQYYYDGSAWTPAQQKFDTNQEPLYDAFDANGYSAGDGTVYQGTKFTGTKIFGYSIGTGSTDTELNFPLTYKNFENVGDIEFSNFFQTDTFAYLSGFSEVTKSINNFVLKEKTTTGSKIRNIWTPVDEDTKQFQSIIHEYNGTTNYFEIDVLPEASKMVPYFKVYVGGKRIAETTYTVTQYGGRLAVVIDVAQLTVGQMVVIKIYSKQKSNLGFYNTPNNLDLNPLNNNFASLTLGQIRNHLIQMADNHYGVSGPVLGKNNLRDLYSKNWQGSILQHSSPLSMANLFLVDRDLNVVQAIEYAQREYNKFKNRFLDMAARIQINTKDIPTSVDAIMASIMVGKSSLTPWYDSDMVPYGSKFRTVTNIPVLNTRQTTYLIPSTFDPTVLSRRAVIVYRRDTSTGEIQQLLKDVDFTFITSTSSIELKSHVALTYTTVLSIVDYTNTTENYVPETPTKLGMYPKFTPQIITDNTYRTPIQMIQGHDGSLTPAFGDYRDDLLLELEKRIYNNIKVQYDDTLLEVYDTLPGKFRNSDYTRREFNQLLTRTFLTWVGNNRLDYSSNSYFDPNDSWTWTYSRLKDSSGENLPGHWRGIYDYFYDTDRPHTHPWEMLGFAEKPTWWEDQYGPAPYTGGNSILWEHLEAGYIAGGSRAGNDARFARPGLSKIIPVNDVGELISPVQLVVANYDSNSTSSPFVIGDQGPVETAWRRSSDYPFAIQIALILARPGFYLGTQFDNSRYNYDAELGQIVDNETRQRIIMDLIKVPDAGLHGSDVVLAAGYGNWVRDYLAQQGIDGSAKMRDYFTKLDVRLSYKVAGFTDKNMLEVVAEQSSPASAGRNIVIPSENYRIHLNKSTPTRRLIYSAVIVEVTERGWKVSGYDTTRPYFTIIPSEINNNAYQLKELKIGVAVYKDFQRRKVTVPYGFEFTTHQQLADFLTSYGRYLKASGFVFDRVNEVLAVLQDWDLSIREYLMWAQQGWKPGSVLVLSPIGGHITVVSQFGVVDHVTNRSTGNRMLDQNFNLIRQGDYSVTRDGGVFTATTSNNKMIALADFSLVEYEHILVFDNTTVFSDVIYQPEIGNRQYRLRLTGFKSGAWNGQLYAPGYVYNNETVDDWQPGVGYSAGSLVAYKNQYYLATQKVPELTNFDFNYWRPIDSDKIKTGLLPNFSNNANKFRYFYDADQMNRDETADQYANGLIGFRNRSFLQDLGIPAQAQLKFYQGYIKQKGTKNAIDSLTAGQFDRVSSEITLYEEWALRVGEYGATGSDQFVEVVLDEQKFTEDPATVYFLDKDEPEISGVVNFNPYTIYRSSEETYSKNIVKARADKTPRIGDNVTAGYPRLDDIDGTMYDISKYQDYFGLVNELGAGYKLWVAVDFNKSWNVYRATETDVLLVSITRTSSNNLLMTFDKPHGASAKELIVIKNFNDNEFDGFYIVSSIQDNLSFLVTGYRSMDTFAQIQSIESTGVYLRMVSVRFDQVSEIIDFTPPHGWRNKDRVWIDNDTDVNQWGVFEKTDGWKFDQLLPLRQGEDRFLEGYGKEVRLSVDNQLILAGTPNFTNGSITGLRVIDPGSNYESPAVRISGPTGEFGEVAQFVALKDNGRLTKANVLTSGSGYTIAPNVTITDEYSTVTTQQTLNEDLLYLPTGATAHVYVGDYVSGTGIPDGWQVVDIDEAQDIVTINGEAYTGLVSATVIPIATGTVTFTTGLTAAQTPIVPGSGIRAYVSGDNTQYIEGYVVSFEGTTLTAEIEVIEGTGTYSSWVITTQLSVRSGTDLLFYRGSAGRVVTTLTPTTVDYIEVVNGGSGFVLTPTVEIVGGGGSGAEATAIISGGVIDSIVLTNPGSGYTEAPDVILLSNNPVAVDLRARLSLTTVGNIVVTDRGQDFREPTITITAHTNDVGVGAAGSLNFYGNGGIQSVTITNRGKSYGPTTTVTMANSLTGSGFVGAVNVYANGAVGNVTITSPGSGYDTAFTVANIYYTGGTGATGNIGRTINGIAEFTGGTVVSYGQGYLEPPTVEIVDQSGSGAGAIVEAVMPTGQVKTFLRPTQNATTVEETQLIKAFNNDAREFGYSVDVGTVLAAIGAPASYAAQGGVYITQTLGSQWISYQMLEPADLVDDARFGHCVVMSNDQQWIYVGAPGANKVYCYGRKTQSFARVTLTPVSGQLAYATNLFGLKSAKELKVLGSNGKLYEPGFDYDVDAAGGIYFADNDRIVTQDKIYITRQRLQTTITPTVIRNLVTRTYALESRPETIDQLLVYGATGRVFVPNKEFTIIGGNIIFLDDSFLSEPSIVVVQRDVFYQLVEVLEPTDSINNDANFGWSIRCDLGGYRIIVGAPDADGLDEDSNVIPSAGRVYTFARSYEVLLSLGDTNIFTLEDLRTVVSVSIDNVMLTNLVDYVVDNNTITLTNIPRNGARIKVDTNFFNLIQVIPCPTVVNLGRFGYTVDISPDNKSLVVGSPGYRDDLYYNGHVYRYVNKGLFYGTVVTEKKFNEVDVTLGELIKINDKPATFSQITAGVSTNVSVMFSSISDTISISSNVGLAIGDSVIGPDIDAGARIQIASWADQLAGVYSNVVLTGTVTVSSGDSLQFTRYGDNITRIKKNIDAAGAVAVETTETADGYLQISVSSDSNLRSLDILPGASGVALEGIGLNVYELTQTIGHPRYGVPEKFGTQVAIDDTGNTLVIASEGGNTLKTSTFDNEITMFDKDTTRFIDSLNASGAVYIYDYLSPPGETLANGGKLLYNQVLQNAYVLTGDNFGSSIDVNRGWALVGANLSGYHATKAGAVHLFVNDGDVKGWSRLRERGDEVDIDYINKLFLYNKSKQVSLQDLDYFDPAKGKILGLADQDLDFKSSYDPAYYNRGTRSTVTVTENSYWTSAQVGQTWWDLSLARYINYEQGPINYRSTHWGELFPDSVIQVCEWVQSSVLPSEYAELIGDGEAKYPDNSAYVEQSYYDSTTGLIKTNYYYWVINKQLFDKVRTGKTSSIVTLEALIRDPQSQGIPYAAAVAPNAFNLYNFKTQLSSTDTVLRVEYSRIIGDIISHNEYELIQQGSPNSTIPEKLISKLIDSLSGENSAGAVVPDLRLNEADAYGISNLPRQSMIRDSLSAAKVFVTFVNTVLLSKQITRRRSLTYLLKSEEVPLAGIGFYDTAVNTVDQLQYIPASELFEGFKVLVNQDSDYYNFWTIYEYKAATGFRMVRIQSYDTTRWWNYQDWYATGYDQYTDIDYVVPTYTDVLKLNLVAGDVVKVLDSGKGFYTVYKYESTGTLTEIIVENGTIQLSTGLYDSTQSRIGFDNSAFDQVGFSTTQSVELRNIFQALSTDIFIDSDAVELNNLFFTMLNYILSEQVVVDWAIKTSLVTVLHKIRKLEQFSNYIKDNQTYYEDYINEVKPYRTQIREYLLDYQGTEYLNPGVSDFDFPSIYDKSTGNYRVLDINSKTDLALINSSSRKDWLEHYAYQIQSLSLNYGGTGYTNTPRVAITGGGGKGATARAVLGAAGADGTASVVDIILTNPGSGYTSQPTVEFIGGNGTGASAAVQLVQATGTAITSSTLNKKVRSILTKIKFDRVSYTSELRPWAPYEIYHPGDIIVLDDVRLVNFANYTERMLPRYSFVYRVLQTLTGRSTIDLNIFEDATIVEKLSGSDLDNANDRLAAYLKPGTPKTAKLYSSPNTIRLDASAINDQIISVAKQWNSVRHSGFYPVQHGYQYAAVGDASLIGLSQDGINWVTNRITDTTKNARDAFLYRNYTWVVVANQGTIYTTDDGENWVEEQITQYRYDPTNDEVNGKLQENTAQTLDLTSGASAMTTYADYLLVVGNNGSILAAPRGNSSFALEFDGWYNVRVQNQVFTQDYLRVLSVDFGDLADIDGTTYDVEIQPVSGYFTESNSVNKRRMKSGFVITLGVNGAINVVTYNALDDMMQGYLNGYNYKTGKAGNTSYPWKPLSVPLSIKGLNDGLSGEQLTSVAVSDPDTNWLVAVGSNGTLLWNQYNIAIETQDGRAELAPDTIGKTVVDYRFRSFENFRKFEDSNFVAPLTAATLAGIELRDVTWDGEKFVVVGNNGVILWGTPGAKSDAYIDIGTFNPVSAVSTRRESAYWTGVTSQTSLTILVPVVDLDARAVDIGMVCYADGIPDDAVVTSVVVAQSGTHEIVVEFATATVASESAANVSFAYGITEDITAGDTITVTDGTTEIDLTVSANAARGDARLYVSDYDERVHSNWRVSGTGIPTGARIRYIAKFAAFAWELAPGSTLDVNLDYRSVTVNTKTITLSKPLLAANVRAGITGLYSGNVVTFYDPTGTIIKLDATQDIPANASILTFESTRSLDVGYALQANTALGIQEGTVVTSVVTYNIGGVVSGLQKDIPDLVPGTGYTGSKVLGTAFTNTVEDALGMDTSISSEFIDNLLGTRPEDITIDGGKFIDTYSSHAPEELVPGQVIDSLQMNVFTANVVNGQPDYSDLIAYKIFTDYKLPSTYYRLSAANTTVLTSSLGYNDTEISVSDISALPDSGSVWINAEKIVYQAIDRNAGKLLDLRRGSLRTSVAPVHAAGSLVTDATPAQLVNTDVTTAITEDVVVENGIVGGSNTATYLSSTVSSIPQGRIWLDIV